jgi:polyisoprenyl-teichoic acid--peptidoglycan teichoic acid transferase
MTERNEQSRTKKKEPATGPLRWVGVVLALYALLVLSVAAIGSFWLYNWARTRIVESSPYAAGAWSARTKPRPEARALVGVSAGAAAPGAESAEQATAPAPSIQPINVLLLGTDARPDDLGPPRTDTLMLLTLDPASQTAGMLSLPRDLWVPIPGLNMTYKINTVYAIGEERRYAGGGAQLLKDTVSSFIGQPVQYYVVVNFNGFVEIVDLIGGVDIDVPKTIHDTEYPTADYGVETFYLSAGRQHLDGATALKYVRTRNVDDDYGRARRQQDLIRALFDQVMSADMIPFLLSKAPTLVYTMRSSIDTDIPMATQFELANYMRTASLNDIRQLVLDSRYGVETYSDDGAWILLPDREKVRLAVDEFFRAPATNLQDGVAVALAAPQARIEVLNGTSQPGVAARTRDLLVAHGLQVVSIGDADRHDYDRTLVINYGASTQVVDEVSAALNLHSNLASLSGMNESTPVDVRIVVGSDILPIIR